MQAQPSQINNVKPTLHDEIQGFKGRLSKVGQSSAQNVGPKGNQGSLKEESKSESGLSEDVNKPRYAIISQESPDDTPDETYASVYQDMFQALAKQETAYDQKVFRAFIAKDFADRFVSPQTRSNAIYRDATTQLLQSESAVDGQPSKSEGTDISPGVRRTAELGMQQVKNIAAIIGQVAKDSPQEAQELFSQLDPTLQKQVMSVQSGSFTSEQKLALLEGVHNNMLGNVISGSRALVSALSLASLGAIFIAGAVLGGPVGGTFAVGLAEMGAVSAHFMASRLARVFASIFENFRLERALSKVDKNIQDLESKLQTQKNKGTENASSPELVAQQKEQLSQLQAKRATLLAKRDAARKQILLKATEFLSGATMLVVVAMIPPPVTVVLVLAALSDFVGSKLEKLSHTFTGPGITSKTARAFLRVFSFALQLPKKLFQGVNNLGKLSEAQAIKTDNKLLSVPLQVVGTILQAPNKLVNGITSRFTKSPEETVSMADDAELRYSVVKSDDQSAPQQEDKQAETVKEGVKDNIKEQKIEMTADVSREAVHLAARSAGGEVVGSFFDVYSSFQDLRAYFFTQPKEKKHLAALIDIVHQEVHVVPVQPNQAVRSSSVGVTVTGNNTEGIDRQKDAQETVASTKREQPSLLASVEKPSHQRLAYSLSQLQGASEKIAEQIKTAQQRVIENSELGSQNIQVKDEKESRHSFRLS